MRYRLLQTRTLTQHLQPLSGTASGGQLDWGGRPPQKVTAASHSERDSDRETRGETHHHPFFSVNGGIFRHGGKKLTTASRRTACS